MSRLLLHSHRAALLLAAISSLGSKKLLVAEEPPPLLSFDSVKLDGRSSWPQVQRPPSNRYYHTPPRKKGKRFRHY